MKSINAAMNYQSKISRNGLAVVAFIATALVIADADACSRVFYNTNPKYTIVSRTIDYFQDFPSVLQINPVGVSRNGGITDEHSAYWVSKYGSVVINGVLDESKPGITADGINTAGFAFHGLLLSNSEYEPRNPTKPGVSMKRYGQFLLDNASSVAEAIGLMSMYQVVQDPDSFYSQLPMHIALEDVQGDSAIVEFVPVDGSHQMKIYHGKEHRILTNDPDYISQLNNLSQYRYFHDPAEGLPLPGEIDSDSRFARGSGYLKSLIEKTTLCLPENHQVAMSYVKSIIMNMAAPFGSLEFNPEQNRYEPGWETRVTNLYDLKTKRLAFINNKLGTEFRVEMNKISFDKKNPIRCLKMDNPRLIGDVTSRFLKKSCPLQ